MAVWLLAGGALAFGLGVWIGLGAPGWPRAPRPGRRLRRRALNPIARGRSEATRRDVERPRLGRRGP